MQKVHACLAWVVRLLISQMVYQSQKEYISIIYEQSALFLWLTKD